MLIYVPKWMCVAIVCPLYKCLLHRTGSAVPPHVCVGKLYTQDLYADRQSTFLTIFLYSWQATGTISVTSLSPNLNIREPFVCHYVTVIYRVWVFRPRHLQPAGLILNSQFLIWTFCNCLFLRYRQACDRWERRRNMILTEWLSLRQILCRAV